jgi:hypothetical protein
MAAQAGEAAYPPHRAVQISGVGTAQTARAFAYATGKPARKALLRRERTLVERQAKPLPHVDQCLGEPVDERIGMIG